jgi:hypothetical protein
MCKILFNISFSRLIPRTYEIVRLNSLDFDVIDQLQIRYFLFLINWLINENTKSRALSPVSRMKFTIQLGRIVLYRILTHLVYLLNQMDD